MDEAGWRVGRRARAERPDATSATGVEAQPNRPVPHALPAPSLSPHAAHPPSELASRPATAWQNSRLKWAVR